VLRGRVGGAAHAGKCSPHFAGLGW
jgi:hypothetical protein